MNERLTIVLDFLSASRTTQARALERQIESRTTYIDQEGGAVELPPAELLLSACQIVVDEEFINVPEGVAEILGEISSLITMMIDLARRIDYHYALDKSGGIPAGPYDHGWEILRRLTKHACMHLEYSRPREPDGARLVAAAGFRIDSTRLK